MDGEECGVLNVDGDSNVDGEEKCDFIATVSEPEL